MFPDYGHPITPYLPTTGQAKIAVTSTAVMLPITVPFKQIIIIAKVTNTADILVGIESVANTEDGTGTGVIVPPGASITMAASDSIPLYINGTSGDIISYITN